MALRNVGFSGKPPNMKLPYKSIDVGDVFKAQEDSDK